MTNKRITPKNILHHNLSKPKDEITLDNLLEKSSTDNVSDALKNLTGKKGVINHVKPIDPDYKVVGYINTCYTNSDDWGTTIKAIYQTEKDEILFVKCSDSENAVWGEMASQAAKKHGLKATVIYGASRDTPDIKALNYPVFSKEIRCNAGLPKNEGNISEHLIIDDRVVSPGDLLVADYDGVVIIPNKLVDDVLKEVNNIKQFESKCISDLLKNDKPLDEILNIK
jgi:regulator of RNase E activity RraA